MTKEVIRPRQTPEGYFFEPMHKIVLTGGPAAGKTTAISHLKRTVGHLTTFTPEVATLLLDGGFPRRWESPEWRNSFQYGVATTQIAVEEAATAIAHHNFQEKRLYNMVCDRGLADGAAYLPGGIGELSELIGQTQEQILGRYGLVIHLVTSAKYEEGYRNRGNPHRWETAAEALRLDNKILDAWQDHPNLQELHITSKEDRNAKIEDLVTNFIKETT